MPQLLYPWKRDPVPSIIEDTGWAPGPVDLTPPAPPPRCDHLTIQPIDSRYTNYTTPAHKKKYLIKFIQNQSAILTCPFDICESYIEDSKYPCIFFI